jgi:RNA polymerase sigma factor (sigma-70 family)
MPATFASADDVCDPLLRTYRDCDPRDAERLRNALVRDEALSVIRAVVEARFRGEREEVDDLCNDVVVQMLARLGAVRDDEEAAPIVSFRGYVATTAHRACDARLRQRYPERHRLRNRIRYVLTHRAEFFLLDDGREWRCGFARDREAADATPRLPADVRRDRLHGEELVSTLADCFRAAGGPVEIEALISLLARGLDAPQQRLRDENSSTAPATSIEQQSSLRRLWSELVQLPRPQRVALLFNLRSSDGEEVLSLLPLTGVASLFEIAAALELEPRLLAEIWNDLPLADARIGEMLGLTRQQVINLRKSARERLTRRLRA